MTITASSADPRVLLRPWELTGGVAWKCIGCSAQPVDPKQRIQTQGAGPDEDAVLRQVDAHLAAHHPAAAHAVVGPAIPAQRTTPVASPVRVAAAA